MHLLKLKKGVYSFYNTLNGKQYIGSSVDLRKRLLEHIKTDKSNKALHKAFNKYGLNNFDFLVYEFSSETELLTNLETKYISQFPLDCLYNFKKEATSMVGYKHTEEAILKMKARFLVKENHPMYGKNHSEVTKLKIQDIKSRFIVSLYDINNILLKTFKNNVELANYLGITKSTVGRYIKYQKLFKGLYYFNKGLK